MTINGFLHKCIENGTVTKLLIILGENVLEKLANNVWRLNSGH